MSEVAFRIQELDSITKEVCELCDLELGTRVQTPTGKSMYICNYCRKKGPKNQRSGDGEGFI